MRANMLSYEGVLHFRSRAKYAAVDSSGHRNGYYDLFSRGELANETNVHKRRKRPCF